MAALEEQHRKLLEEPNFAFVGTIRKDGSPHVVPTWVDLDGDKVVLNSAEGRAWPANLRRDNRLNLTIPNRENPYEYLEIRGRLVEDTHEGAKEHADALAKKYLGLDEYPFLQPGEERIIFKIEPERVYYQNPG